ncbi:MAG: hypothetical protein JWR19_4624 [Pedosphaera sp.]|nr:hypothetical protein [Pedosphaera sp.]
MAADPALSAPAITALRDRGPAGLDALWQAHAQAILQHEANSSTSASPEDQNAWQRLKTALDKVSGQRDCRASHLYWYTDLEQAKAAASASGKPILSLRLLGKLDEEYSCANSRFFRTTLYANTEIATYLRQHFVLHWKSVRPVPRITVDFGDGRKIEQTITGNSIHYILAPNGEVIDALPGLYGPKAFKQGLADAEKAVLQCNALAVGKRADFLMNYHREQLQTLAGNWSKDLAQLQRDQATAANASSSLQVQPALFQIKAATQPDAVPSDSPIWNRIATLHLGEAELDAGAQKLIASKTPTAYDASRVAFTKSVAENPFLAMMRNLQRSLAEDTVRNEYHLHFTIHEWFVKGVVPANLDQLNAKVYAQLFLTPDSDPWLGMAPANTFTGLDNNGLIKTP